MEEQLPAECLCAPNEDLPPKAETEPHTAPQPRLRQQPGPSPPHCRRDTSSARAEAEHSRRSPPSVHRWTFPTTVSAPQMAAAGAPRKSPSRQRPERTQRQVVSPTAHTEPPEGDFHSSLKHPRISTPTGCDTAPVKAPPGLSVPPPHRPGTSPTRAKPTATEAETEHPGKSAPSG